MHSVDDSAGCVMTVTTLTLQFPAAIINLFKLFPKDLVRSEGLALTPGTLHLDNGVGLKRLTH